MSFFDYWSLEIICVNVLVLCLCAMGFVFVLKFMQAHV